MITVSCGACGKELHLADSVGGSRVPCPQCGGVVAVPALAEKPKGSKTARAVEAAMRAMDAKEGQRGRAEAGSTAKPPARTAYQLGGQRSEAGASSASRDTPKKRAMRPAHWTIAAALGLVVILIGVSYALFAPSSWESSQRQRILSAKTEAQRLESEGKTLEAYERYGTIVLAVSNKPIHDSELRKAVEQAREARTRLFPQVRDLEEKARTAKFVH